MALVGTKYRVKPGERIHLKDIDPADTQGWEKAAGKQALVDIQGRLNKLQTLLYATEKHALLIVLQGMDTAGKDGVIKHVVGALNPQGCEVNSFKVPSKIELAHDFLWRVHRATPPRGKVGIFNRSYYEDVLVVRVEDLVPKSVWRKRYDAIREFEELLAENGVVVLKFFLHISKKRQHERLVDRINSSDELWKFRASDLETRAKWDEYMAAYEDALYECSTEDAPWYVIPSDRKWYRNLLVSQIVAETLEALEMEWPPLEEEAVGIEII